MSFLPVVERELRAACRRRGTYRARWWTALLAMVVALFTLLVASASGGRVTGSGTFSVFSYYALMLCVLAGVFLTADAVSEERRQGTLGLLFLTDLRGYDIVLGKFMACWLNAFYALLGLLPAAALPVLLGGVTGAEFWRTALALINALFFSLAVGLCVSTFHSDSQRAMGHTLAWLLLFVAGFPIIAETGRRFLVAPSWLGFTWLSPFYPFSYASDVLHRLHPGTFWATLFGSGLMAWCFLGAASLALPHVWQEKAVKQGEGRVASWFKRRSLPPAKRARLRAKLLPVNPVLWLIGRGYRPRWVPWLVVASWAGIVASSPWWAPGGSPNALVSTTGPFGFGMVTPFGFLLKLLLALQACHFFVEGRRNGTLDLLLCTPCADRDIIRGQSLALWRNFRWPVGLFLLLLFAPLVLGLLEFPGNPFGTNYQLTWLGGLFLCLAYTARMIVDLFAVCWFGMGMALTTKRPNLAAAFTVLVVLILPSVLCWLDILVDLIFISWGKRKCQQQLRHVLLQQFETRLPPVVYHLPQRHLPQKIT